MASGTSPRCAGAGCGRSAVASRLLINLCRQGKRWEAARSAAATSSRHRLVAGTGSRCSRSEVDTVRVVAIGVTYLILWVICFVIGLLLDEDVNHWDWPTDSGPGALATGKIAAVAALAAVAPLGLLLGFGELVKYLATL